MQVYRRAEARGEIRGGRFVANFVGEQYAIPEAVERLRTMRRTDKDDRFVVLSACDPLNLAGITTPGSRVPALLDNKVVYRNGGSGGVGRGWEHPVARRTGRDVEGAAAFGLVSAT